MNRKQRHDAKRRIEQPWRAWYRSKRWYEIKHIVLQAQPICRLCNKAPSEIVDHVTAHRGDPHRFWNGPFQALCKRCHDTTKQKWEKERKPLTPEQAAWLDDLRTR